MKRDNMDEYTLRRKVMVVTLILGGIVAILFPLCTDTTTHFGLIWGTFIYYPVAWVVIAVCFRRTFGDQSVWVATLSTLPMYIALIGPLILDSLEFLRWYAVAGIVSSVLIFEYKFLQ